MYDYEILLDATKKQVEELVDNINDKKELKYKLISLLNENLRSIEKMALDKIQYLKADKISD